MTQDDRIAANSEAISANADAIRANAEAIRKQTEYLHEIRNHFIPEEEARFKRFAKYVVTPLVKAIALIAFIDGLWDVIAWVIVENRSDLNSNVCNVVSAKILYPDVPPDEFSVEDWAEELAEKAGQGLHIRNGQVLVVARIPVVEGEYQSLTKLRAKFRAVELLRQHCPNLPTEFSASCRIFICEELEDSGQVAAVVAFLLKDLPLVT